MLLQFQGEQNEASYIKTTEVLIVGILLPLNHNIFIT